MIQFFLLLAVSAAAIGQDGIQLFIDAGIPVDRELVTNLIREVIAENVSTILGHPKPRASPRPSRVSELFHWSFFSKITTLQQLNVFIRPGNLPS